MAYIMPIPTSVWHNMVASLLRLLWRMPGGNLAGVAARRQLAQLAMAAAGVEMVG